MGSEEQRERRFNLWGWIGFVVCAGLFIAANLRSGDWLALAASVIFLFGCLLLIIPLLGRRRDG